ncbi:MAG TPA: GNAT family protein [Chloroflexia bacterium]|nr:GNAT family protein [Chloroflexia bacterium]
MKVEPVVLQGRFVRLEPLTLEHAPDLLEAAQDDDVWRYVSLSRPYTLQEMKTIIEGALKQPARLPFATIDAASGRAIGTTSYLDIQPQNRGLEIGWTWLGKPYWKTPRNTECKYLLMKHAFETLGAIRVQLKTDSRNYISQNAIERIGGKKEGVLRRHVIYPSGYIRDSVYYSIIDQEWPEVKQRLETKLAGYSYSTPSEVTN